MKKKIEITYDDVLQFIVDSLSLKEYEYYVAHNMNCFKTDTVSKAMKKFLDTDSLNIQRNLLTDLNTHKYMCNRINDVYIGFDNGLYFFIIASLIDLAVDIRQAKIKDVLKM